MKSVVDDDSPAGRLKDWIAAVITVTVDFTVVCALGWMTPYDAVISIVGCMLGLALIFWIGPKNLTLLGSNSQLVPWLPPNAVAPAVPMPAGPTETPDPDPSTVPAYYRAEWKVVGWIFFVIFSPVLLMHPLRKALDRIG